MIHALSNMWQCCSWMLCSKRHWMIPISNLCVFLVSIWFETITVIKNNMLSRITVTTGGGSPAVFYIVSAVFPMLRKVNTAVTSCASSPSSCLNREVHLKSHLKGQSLAIVRLGFLAREMERQSGILRSFCTPCYNRDWSLGDLL